MIFSENRFTPFRILLHFDAWTQHGNFFFG